MTGQFRLRLHSVCATIVEGGCTGYTILQVRDMYMEAADGNAERALQLARRDLAEMRDAQ